MNKCRLNYEWYNVRTLTILKSIDELKQIIVY